MPLQWNKNESEDHPSKKPSRRRIFRMIPPKPRQLRLLLEFQLQQEFR